MEAFIVRRLVTLVVREDAMSLSLCLLTSCFLSATSRELYPMDDAMLWTLELLLVEEESWGRILIVVPWEASVRRISAKSSGPLSRTRWSPT